MLDERVSRSMRALGRHIPLDNLETEHLDATLAFLDANIAPLSRFNPAGHVTASCVAIHSDRPEMLVLWHTKIGRWLQPGGHVEDADTSVSAAALRELCEETGATPADVREFLDIVDVDVHLIPAYGLEAPHYHYDVRFGFVMSAAFEPSEGAIWKPAAEVLATLDTPTARLGRKVLILRG